MDFLFILGQLGLAHCRHRAIEGRFSTIAGELTQISQGFLWQRKLRGCLSIVLLAEGCSKVAAVDGGANS